jgi:hypothetical protein
LTGHGNIMGYRIRDRAGRFFGFAGARRAAWEDAWLRLQEAAAAEKPEWPEVTSDNKSIRL